MCQINHAQTSIAASQYTSPASVPVSTDTKV